MNELLQRLTEAVGISSGEREIRNLIYTLIDDHVDEVRVDSMGSLIAIKRGTDDSHTVVVDAHMDEVGLVISGIDPDGTLQFETMGGFDSRALLGKVVQVGPKKHVGVIGARAVHLLSASQRDSMPARSGMRIDIGATKRENAAAKVSVGDLAAFTTKYVEQGDIAIGKSFDDRAGCAALIELLKGEPYLFTLVGVFSVQEEVGLRGATAAAKGIRPDLALILECTPAYDLPNERDISPNVALGKGPSLYVMDSGTIQHPRLVRHIMQTADANDIPFQVRQPGGGGTNTSAYQRAALPIPAATIALPGRYAHSPTMMISLSDYANVVALADATLRSLDFSQLLHDAA